VEYSGGMKRQFIHSTSPIKNLTRTIYLTLAVLLGSMGTSWSADFNKGIAAYQSGDFATALRELRPLAEQGHDGAQFAVGTMYDTGRGVPQDYKTAVKWYTLGAEQGEKGCQWALGDMYVYGQGVPQDYKTAVKWYTLAAEQGSARAQYMLGGMYAYGLGVPQDKVYAHMWWNLAAASGDKNAFKKRDIVATEMTPTQIEKAQDLARECVRKKYTGC